MSAQNYLSRSLIPSPQKRPQSVNFNQGYYACLFYPSNINLHFDLYDNILNHFPSHTYTIKRKINTGHYKDLKSKVFNNKFKSTGIQNSIAKFVFIIVLSVTRCLRLGEGGGGRGADWVCYLDHHPACGIHPLLLTQWGWSLFFPSTSHSFSFIHFVPTPTNIVTH